MFRRKFYFIVALAVLMVVGFLTTSIISYFVASDSLSRQISEQTLPLTSDNIYSEIQRDLLRPVLISSLMASDTFLREWIMDGEHDPEQIRSYLQEIQQRYGTITAFFISEESRNYYHSSGILKQVSSADPDDAWYFRVRGMNEPYEINIDSDTADRSRLSIFVNYRVHDFAGGFLGATGVGLAVESVTQMIDNYQQRYGRNIYFIDRQGNITLTGTDGQITARRLQDRLGNTLSTQVLSVPSTSLNYLNGNGEDVFLNSRLVPEFNWYLIVEQQGSEAAGLITGTLWVNVVLSLGILLLVLTAAHFILRNYQLRLEQMATTDQLTGIANRHMLEQSFDEKSAGKARAARPLSLIIADIDHFKRINDVYGHPGGDLVLQTVANTIKEHIRESDTLCRWGGEEFVLLLDNCSAREAMIRVKSICDAVRQLRIPFGKEYMQVTLSCGVGERHKGESLEFLVKRVDAVLYDAKQQGRDQIRLAEPETV